MRGTNSIKKLSRMLQFLPNKEAGLVREMDKTLGGTWIMLQLSGLGSKEIGKKGEETFCGVDVDDDWVSKLHKHLWELQGIWKSIKIHAATLEKLVSLCLSGPGFLLVR